MSTDSYILTEFGRRITALRVDAGLTQQRVSDMIGLARSSVSNMEAGRQEPGIGTLVDLSRALGVPVGELLGFDPVSDPLPWFELARRVTAAERDNRRKADRAWREHDVITAVRHRALADGLEMARDLHAVLLAEYRKGRLTETSAVSHE